MPETKACLATAYCALFYSTNLDTQILSAKRKLGLEFELYGKPFRREAIPKLLSFLKHGLVQATP
eukprot:559403-Amphidinium_carterae.1